MRAAYLLLLIGLVNPFNVLATHDKLPPITATSISGVWEAVSVQHVSVFRLQITNSTMLLALAIPPGEGPSDVDVFRTDTFSVKNGKLVATLKELAGTHSISLKGAGVAGDADGLMELTLTLKDGKPLRKWKLTFARCTSLEMGTFVQALSRLSDLAADTIQKTKDTE